MEIRLEDILKLSISEVEAKALKFPIVVYVPEPAGSASPMQIKRALLGALMYPLEMLYPDV